MAGVPETKAWRAKALACALALGAAVATPACGGRFEGGGDLRARKKVLEREVAGLRDAVLRLERHESLLPQGDLAVAIDDALLQGVIAAQMPFESAVGDNQLTLEHVAVRFRGAPTVELRGRLRRHGRFDLEAVVDVIGALDAIAVDGGRGALTARIAVDHVAIQQAAGIEKLLAGSTLDELARTIRLQLADKLPAVQIPVKVQQAIELPAVTTGPVRIDGARMPIAASVSGVLAGQGRLWVAIHFELGEPVKTADAPEAQDTSAADVETGFDALPASGDAKRDASKAAEPRR